MNFSYGWFALVLVLNGVGMGLFTSPNSAGVMNSLPPSQRGAGAGMLATFTSSASVLSIGVFFSLMVLGLSRQLPSAMSSGLIQQGVPAARAAQISHLPPISVLFASFLGYNPMQQLLGPVLATLPAAHAAYVVGRQFFPQLITAPFKDGLGVAFGFAAGATVLGAVAAALTGKVIPVDDAETHGGQLAAVAGEGDFEPSELVVPDPAAEPGRNTSG